MEEMLTKRVQHPGGLQHNFSVQGLLVRIQPSPLFLCKSHGHCLQGHQILQQRSGQKTGCSSLGSTWQGVSRERNGSRLPPVHLPRKPFPYLTSCHDLRFCSTTNKRSRKIYCWHLSVTCEREKTIRGILKGSTTGMSSVLEHPSFSCKTCPVCSPISPPTKCILIFLVR